MRGWNQSSNRAIPRMFNYHFVQYCVDRPKTVFILTLVSCFLVILYTYNSDTVVVLRNNQDVFHDDETVENNRSPRLAEKRASGDRRTSYQVIGDESNDNSPVAIELNERIEDLRRIKASVIEELKSIEREKVKILKEKAALISRNEKLNLQISRGKSQLRQLELDISSNRRRKFEQNCDVDRVAPVVFNPLKSEEISPNTQFFHSSYQFTSRQNYDLSKCPLTQEFRFHVSEQSESNLINNRKSRVDPSLVIDVLRSHRQYTENPDAACLYIIFTRDSNATLINASANHLIIDIWGAKRKLGHNIPIASSTFQKNSFRNQFDLVVPSIWQPPQDYESIVGSIPAQSPVIRRYLASYFGNGKSNLNQPSQDPATQHLLSPLEEILQVVHRNSIEDLFLFIYNCDAESNSQCYEEKEKMIELSTFLIILPSKDADLDEYTNELIYLSLSRGAIPVIIGKEQVRLPFDEVVDWRRAAILVPTGRLPEIHFIMRSISPADLYQLKYHGRRIFEQYLATTKQILDTVVAVMSLERFNYPPPPVLPIHAESYNDRYDLIIDANCSTNYCMDSKLDTVTNLVSSEIFGPRDIPFASPTFRRNFSLALNSVYDLWNNPLYSVFHLYPNSPNDPIPPSEYKFFSTDNGYRPIADGLGGSGDEFSRAIGGDYPNEQFTIVLLTYERESIMMKTLERLKGLAYLNKVLVIWNGVKHEPSEDMIWPDIGVPIKLIKTSRNSLNNRFLPYDAIETDAILSLDDDSPLRPDEIVFAFRVWRQSRDRIVGFPGRYHAWDRTQNSWLYNSNHSCELSMVLTGGAFFHKYYTYVYTYSMPEVVRAIVDKFMNCEDIAMNFLVAHLTRKPPIKVTSRWTFHCPSCPSSLSEDDSHFRERHECLNTFTSIYGYMPLLSTQQRSDSVLFKTRLPHDKQKCFRFV